MILRGSKGWLFDQENKMRACAKNKSQISLAMF
jgi:hypothetical protein